MKPSEDPYGRFIEPTRVLRDPIHGDVRITSLETKIIDTRAFQRLHRIKQLGYTYLIFPGATHTRFSHSIGTLHSSQQLLESIGRNLYSETRLSPYSILLTRLCALLHDLAHIPFGHTLEDEGNIFPSQWDDKFRVEYFLGMNSEVGNIIRSEVSDECLEDIIRILTAKSNAEIERLQYPYIADIVGDTFCADLLDYSRRDSYYTGLHDILDLRLIRHISIGRLVASNAERVVLRLGDNEGNVRKDRCWALLDLLRLRYRLMEAVIYHHTKMRASAMIIDAVYDSLREKKITKLMMCEIGDDELLAKLERDGTGLSKSLIRNLTRRKLHKPMLVLSGLPAHEGANINGMKEKFKFYSIPHNRWNLQRELERKYHLPEGSIIIYCPKMRESNKSSTLMVSLGPKVVPLSEFPDNSIREEVALIEKLYLRLWTMAILVDNNTFSSENIRRKLSEDCLVEFGSKRLDSKSI